MTNCLRLTPRFEWLCSMRPVAVIICLLLPVPPNAAASALSDSDAEECAKLWEDRNRIFVDRGLCIDRPLAHFVFGERSCTTDDPASIALDVEEHKRVDDLRAREVFLGCVMDLDSDNLFEAARNLVVKPNEYAVAFNPSGAPVNIHAGPNASFEIRHRMEPGQRVIVMERVLNPQKSHRWVEVEYITRDGGDVGYVYFDYLRPFSPAIAPNAPFADFPSPPHASAAPKLEEIVSRIEDSRARNAAERSMKQGPNFAGDALFVTWRCGEGECTHAGIADPRTDTWIELPFSMHQGRDKETEVFTVRRDSALIVARGWRDGADPGLFQYHWDGTDLTLLSDALSGDIGDYATELRRAQDADLAGDNEAAYAGFLRALAGADSTSERVAAMEGVAVAVRALGMPLEGLAYAQRARQLAPNEKWIAAYIASHDPAAARRTARIAHTPRAPANEFEEAAAPILESLDALLDALD